MATLRPQKAEEHMERQLETQRRTLSKYGIGAGRVEEEVRAFATQIRCELHRYVAGGQSA